MYRCIWVSHLICFWFPILRGSLWPVTSVHRPWDAAQQFGPRHPAAESPRDRQCPQVPLHVCKSCFWLRGSCGYGGRTLVRQAVFLPHTAETLYAALSYLGCGANWHPGEPEFFLCSSCPFSLEKTSQWVATGPQDQCSERQGGESGHSMWLGLAGEFQSLGRTLWPSISMMIS